MNQRYHKQALLTAIAIAGATGVASAAVQQYSFERYRSILDRQPFGEVEPDTRPTPPPGPVAPPFTKDIIMCAITEDASGIKVGFVDVARKPPKSYLLSIGESEDGITLVDADYTREKASLEKNGKEEWLSMAAPVSSVKGGASQGAASARPASRRAKRSSGGASKHASAEKERFYTERMRVRREFFSKAIAKHKGLDVAAMTDEALEKHLEEHQMERIRAGQRALPVALKPETDAKLVADGVLPPLEQAEVSAR